MCKMFAVSTAKEDVDLGELVKDLLIYYSRDNRDGYGIAFESHEQIIAYKHTNTPEALIGHPANKYKVQALIGHVRNSSGTPANERNTHPFVSEDGSVAFIHNGYIRGLKKSGNRRTSDSERMFERIMEGYNYNPNITRVRDFSDGINRMKEIDAGSKLNILMLYDDGTILGISDGDLYLAEYDGDFIFTSTKVFDNSYPIKQGHAIAVRYGNKIIEEFKMFSPNKPVFRGV